jgi:hypothetical protein
MVIYYHVRIQLQSVTIQKLNIRIPEKMAARNEMEPALVFQTGNQWLV